MDEEFLKEFIPSTNLSIEEVNHLMNVLLGDEKLSSNIDRCLSSLIWKTWKLGIVKGLNASQFKDMLKKYDLQYVDNIVEVYKNRLDDLRKHFVSIRFVDSTVVNSEWIVMKEKESGSEGNLGRNSSSTCHLTLRILKGDKISYDSININLNKEQLQDLYWTLKGAQNVMNKIMK